jgi:hypothetical protein
MPVSSLSQMTFRKPFAPFFPQWLLEKGARVQITMTITQPTVTIMICTCTSRPTAPKKEFKKISPKTTTHINMITVVDAPTQKS